eukprot:6341920-Pyramimonas_sp.AAC.1
MAVILVVPEDKAPGAAADAEWTVTAPLTPEKVKGAVRAAGHRPSCLQTSSLLTDEAKTWASMPLTNAVHPHGVSRLSKETSLTSVSGDVTDEEPSSLSPILCFSEGQRLAIHVLVLLPKTSRISESGELTDPCIQALQTTINRRKPHQMQTVMNLNDATLLIESTGLDTWFVVVVDSRGRMAEAVGEVSTLKERVRLENDHRIFIFVIADADTSDLEVEELTKAQANVVSTAFCVPA